MSENVIEQTGEKEFSQEDISSVKGLQTGYAKLQTQEQELIDSLNSKYGDGVLDLDSGKFIPVKS